MLDDVKKGKIKVIVGSTFKLGVGINIQAKLIAIHHLDVPWRPSDMMQREGRLIREGNTNKEVFVYRYIHEGSFDAYSWQILERKAKIIRDILANSLSEKETQDIENTVLSYAEVKAIAVGNNKIKEHIELLNHRNRLLILAKKQNERYESLFNEIDLLKGKISDLNRNNILIKKDILHTHGPVTKDMITKFKQIIDNIETYFDKDEEQVIFKFYDFDIILPPFFGSKNKYYLVKCNHTYKYQINIFDDDFYQKFNLINISSNLCSINYMINSNKSKIDEYENAILCIKDELENKIDFNPELEEINSKIKIIKEELGINNER